MITQLIWTIWTSLSAVPRKAVKFNHSLTHLLCFISLWLYHLIGLWLRQNGRHFADNIFKLIFLDVNVWILINIQLKCVHVWILINISLKCVPKGQIKKKLNIPALVQIMAWHLPGDKPLCELMMFNLLMDLCITWLQWINSLSPRGVAVIWYV